MYSCLNEHGPNRPTVPICLVLLGDEAFSVCHWEVSYGVPEGQEKSSGSLSAARGPRRGTLTYLSSTLSAYTLPSFPHDDKGTKPQLNVFMYTCCFCHDAASQEQKH